MSAGAPPPAPMRYRRFAPLARDVSVLVLGTAVYRDAPADAPLDLLDAWVAVGGNMVDCAREYGASEGLLGRWMEERGCRDDVVVVTKAAHPDEHGRVRFAPEHVLADAEESLKALRTDRIDVLLLHRDDPGSPVGPVLEALNELLRARRILCFGASNWSTRRLEEAARYARDHELEPFACSSPHVGLALQHEPPWPGCVSAADADSRRWYADTQLPVLAWSSQSGGFFTGRHRPGRVADPLVERVYDSPENWERLRRAERLARERGATANDVALAWVLHQPFPVHAIVGPHTVPELRSTLGALAVELDADELRWLSLE